MAKLPEAETLCWGDHIYLVAYSGKHRESIIDVDVKFICGPHDKYGNHDQESHNCHFCGTNVFCGYEFDVDPFDNLGNRKRHWLSDCRPDLVKHEIGPLCTWKLMAYSTPAEPHGWDDAKVDEYNLTNNRPGCYAYQDSYTLWTDSHTHFMADGPM